MQESSNNVKLNNKDCRIMYSSALYRYVKGPVQTPRFLIIASARFLFLEPDSRAHMSHTLECPYHQ